MARRLQAAVSRRCSPSAPKSSHESKFALGQGARILRGRAVPPMLDFEAQAKGSSRPEQQRAKGQRLRTAWRAQCRKRQMDDACRLP